MNERTSHVLQNRAVKFAIYSFSLFTTGVPAVQKPVLSNTGGKRELRRSSYASKHAAKKSGASLPANNSCDLDMDPYMYGPAIYLTCPSPHSCCRSVCLPFIPIIQSFFCTCVPLSPCGRSVPHPRLWRFVRSGSCSHSNFTHVST